MPRTRSMSLAFDGWKKLMWYELNKSKDLSTHSF